jgi:electron transport complex protein RnfG
MKQILRITLGLVVSCLIAGTIMSGAYVFTAKAKKYNEHMKEQETMLGLLGYGKANPAPSALKLYSVYRYVVDEKGSKYLGYLIPVKKGNAIDYAVLELTLDGKFYAFHELKLGLEQATDPVEREKALDGVFKGSASFVYADETIVAFMDGKRLAYLLPGRFQGFKTFIRVMLALNPSFDILGLDILEQEEDPGLGGDIVQPYFKNQFKDKTFNKIKELDVVKEPLPEEYRKVLEAKSGSMPEKEVQSVEEKYKNSDIYALTGATISSRAVTTGVKDMVKRFAYRIGVLDHVLASRNIPVGF